MTRITTYQLVLERLVIEMAIGVHDFEIGVQQPVAIDIELDLDGAMEFTADSMSLVVDYDRLRNEVIAFAHSRHFSTQEAFCQGVLTLTLALPRVTAAHVWTRKLKVFSDCTSVGVRLSGAVR